jgi:hypothetical protein
MAVYDLHFNKDDVALRNIIIGLLATLNDSIGWYNQIGSSVEEKLEISVPFYFSTTGTERYLQDNFLNNIDFDPDMLQAETFYNKIPRGIVQFNGFSIDTQAIVNKYIRMNHLRQENDGTLNTYNSEAFMVPILMNLDVDIYVDSIIDQMKCSEAIIRTFYKAKAYQVDIAYTRIPCLITFPDEQTHERTVEFSFTDKQEFKVKFSLEVKSHIPIFKPGTEIFAGNRMEEFGGNILIPPVVYGSTKLNTNTGDPLPEGAIGYTYSGNSPDPTWPNNPSTILPPTV